MSKRTRRRHTPEQKAALIRQHLVDKKPVSESCDAAQIQPSVFYSKRPMKDVVTTGVELM
jgi:transposase-like protein